MPLAVRFSADFLVRVNLAGGLLSSAVLGLFGRVSEAVAAGDWVGSDTHSLLPGRVVLRVA